MCFPPSAEGREGPTEGGWCREVAQMSPETWLGHAEKRRPTGPSSSKRSSESIGRQTDPVPQHKQRFWSTHCMMRHQHYAGGPLMMPVAAEKSSCNRGGMRSSKTIGVSQSGQVGT